MRGHLLRRPVVVGHGTALISLFLQSVVWQFSLVTAFAGCHGAVFFPVEGFAIIGSYRNVTLAVPYGGGMLN